MTAKKFGKERKFSWNMDGENMDGEKDEFQWEIYCKNVKFKQRFLVSKCILELVCFCESCKNQNQGYVSRKCIPEKCLNILVLVCFIFTFFYYNA